MKRRTWNPLTLIALLALAACGQHGEPPVAPAPTVNAAPAPKDERLGVAFQALGAGDNAACRAAAQEVLDEFPQHPRAEFLLALGLHKDKRYAEALPHFVLADTASADFAGKPAVPYYRAWCEYWLGDFDAARTDFERHLETSGEGDSHFGLGAIALELGDLATARVELQQALEIFEANIAAGKLGGTRELAKAHARLADVDLAEGHDADARAHLEAALRLDIDRPAVWFKLYTVALDAGDAELASRARAEYERRSAGASQ